MDKLWAERIRLNGVPYDEYGMEYQRDWLTESSTRSVRKEILPSPRVVLPPQARVADGADGYAWSAALGAVGGAGTVLLIAVLLFIFKKPKKQEPQVLAPMDVAQNLTDHENENKEKKYKVFFLIWDYINAFLFVFFLYILTYISTFSLYINQVLTEPHSNTSGQKEVH